MQYAKRQTANPDADIFNDSELRRVETETGIKKQDQLDILNRKVKYFEEKVQRDEVLMRNRGGNDGGSGSDAAF